MALEGTRELLRQLDQIGRLEDGRALRAAVRAGIKVAESRAQQAIPRGTEPHRTYKGRLVAPGFASRNVLSKVRLSKDKQKATASLGVEKEAFYATIFLELGTAKMAAQPWLVPAFEETQVQQQQKIAATLRKVVLRAARKKGAR